MNTDKTVIPTLLKDEYTRLNTMTSMTIINGALFPAHLREHAIDDYDQLASMSAQLYAESVYAGRPNYQHRADAERFTRNAESLRNGGGIEIGGRTP